MWPLGTLRAMPERVLLHVGTHKTGTTSLQHFLRDEGDLLASVDAAYPPGFAIPTAHAELPLLAVRPERIDIPTGVAVFPAEVDRPPRSAVERKYDVRRWTEMPAGGHFAAMEQPDALVDEIRAFFRPLRV